MRILDHQFQREFRFTDENLLLAPLSPLDYELWRKLGGGPDFQHAREESSGWHRVFCVDRSDASQFDILGRLLGEGFAPPGPIACLALEGSAFHGHRGRPWSALRGNVHLSVALRPADFPARDALAFVVLPAVATVDAVRTATNGAVVPEIKWVNDLLVGGAKLAGVLTATASQADRLSHVLLGVGLNVEQTPTVPATPFVPAVTSLAEQGTGLEHRDLVEPLLNAVLTRYEQLLTSGPGGLIDAYRNACGIVGREVEIYPEGIDDETPTATWPAPIARGRVEAIGDDLSLSLVNVVEPVTRGRLRFLE